MLFSTKSFVWFWKTVAKERKREEKAKKSESCIYLSVWEWAKQKMGLFQRQRREGVDKNDYQITETPLFFC